MTTTAPAAETTPIARRFAGPYEVCWHCEQFYVYIWFRSQKTGVLVCSNCRKKNDKVFGPDDAQEVLSWCHRPVMEMKWRQVKGKPERRLTLGWNGQLFRSTSATVRHAPGAPGGFEWSIHLKDHTGHYSPEPSACSKDLATAEDVAVRLIMAHRIYQ